MGTAGRKQDVVLRQDHRAGEKVFVDWAGDTIPIYDRGSGEPQPASLFVAALGASSHTFARATASQNLANWMSDYHISKMRANPAEAQEHHRRGFQLLSESSYQQARDQFLSAIHKNSDWASPYLGFGQTYFFQEKPDLKEATKAFRRVVELKPDWVEGYHWLGATQQREGTLEDAASSYREAIRIAPSDTRPLIALGTCLTEMGQFAEAVICLRRAVDLNPPYAAASAHLFLADALRGNGELEAACREWRVILDLPSGYPEYESAKKEAAKRLREHCSPPHEDGTESR